MSNIITYINKSNSNELQSLYVSQLSDYILTETEQQYIDSLTNDTTTTISTLLLNASTRAGSTLCNQPNLNKMYVRRDDATYKATDKTNLKEFLNKNIVGNNIVKFTTLE